MYPYCDEPIYGLPPLFVMHPWVSTVVLIAFGIGLGLERIARALKVDVAEVIDEAKAHGFASERRQRYSGGGFVNTGGVLH